MATKGRPTKYLPAYVVLAEYMAKVGAADVQIARAIDASEGKLSEWRGQYPALEAAIQRGREWSKKHGWW